MDIDVLDEILTSVAAREVLPRFGRLSAAEIMEKTSAYDLVTVADREAEKAITELILARWPDAVIVGEETAGTEDDIRARLGADEVVVIDPVDGTKNYAAGLPLFAVMAGVLRRGRIVAGLIHDPVTRTSAVAEEGSGAWLRRPGEQARRLRVADPVPVADMEAVMSRRIGDDPYSRAIEANLRKLARHPWFRCGGHEYRLAASGEVHALCYQRLMPWDHVPGWLLHREAGGYSAHFDGTGYDPARMAGGLLCAPDEASWQEIHRDVLSASRLPAPGRTGQRPGPAGGAPGGGRLDRVAGAL
ncbi:MAG: inositol monophosphatase [Streptosporangiales bacterium]|nr:inositol monophosphatase [Streptosporangiales bacterium]